MQPLQQSTDVPKDWPIMDQPIPLAWEPEDTPVATAIPLTKEWLAAGLQPDQYFEALAWRVAWMLETSEDPERAIATLAWDLQEHDLWTGQSEFTRGWQAAMMMIRDNPAFHSYLVQTFRLPAWGTPLHQMPMAVETIKETTFLEWLDQAVQTHRSD